MLLEVGRTTPTVDVVTMAVPEVGNRSYLVHDGSTAVIVDPQCDTAVMLGELETRHLTVSHVLETHIHNDYVSGGLALSRETGAEYVLSADEPVSFGRERRGVTDGDVLSAGTMAIEVLHTPGHTPHHLSFAVHDADGRAVLFSGGSLLHRGTGRTDLFDPGAADLLARAQWWSARRLVQHLPPETKLFPTHGFGSFCSAAPVDDVGSSTLSEEWQHNPVLMQDEEAFVASLVASWRPYPRYYHHMAPMNRSGMIQHYPATILRTELGDLDPSEGSVLVDLRPRRSFARSHTAGALNVEWSDAFAAYLGWAIPRDAPLVLIAEEWSQLEWAAGALARIGIEEARGALHRERDDDAAYAVAGFEDLRDRLPSRSPLPVVDARDRVEWDADHLRCAVHVPFYCAEASTFLFNRAERVWVHCARGYRAAIAASVLARSGVVPVLVDDSFDAAVALGLTVSSG